MEHVVDGAIVAVYPVGEFGRALDEDLGEQFGRRQGGWRIERQMRESWVLLAYGVPGEFEGTEEQEQGSAFGRFVGDGELL